MLVALLTVACGGRAEEHLLRGYFDACAAADDVALANVALVTLDPKRDGAVGHFRLAGISAPRRRPASTSSHVTRLSLADPLHSHDDTTATLVSRTVTLRAQVHRAGTVAERPIEVTIERAETAGSAVGRWIVVRLVLDGRIVPAASSGRQSGTAP